MLLIAVDIKSICRPQRPFLSRSNESYIITYGLADLERQRNDLTCVVSRKINKNLLSTEKATREPTSTHSVIEIQSKRGSFSNFPSTLTGECILTGSGPWLIPMVLLDRMPKHDLRNAIEASLRANSLSQSPSFHLSLPIAIITSFYITARTHYMLQLGKLFTLFYINYSLFLAITLGTSNSLCITYPKVKSTLYLSTYYVSINWKPIFIYPCVLHYSSSIPSPLTLNNSSLYQTNQPKVALSSGLSLIHI